jgi:hypothetical protein
MRQPSQPLAQKAVDALGGQIVGDGLNGLDLGAPGDAVVQRFVLDAPVRKLPLQVLMAVDPPVSRNAPNSDSESCELLVTGPFVKVIVVVKAPLGCRWSLNAQQRDSGGSKLTE